jgi:hypothetical protein
MTDAEQLAKSTLELADNRRPYLRPIPHVPDEAGGGPRAGREGRAGP